MKKQAKLRIGIAALVLALVLGLSLFAVRTRSWEDLAGDQDSSSMWASLTVNIFDPEGGNEVVQAHVWQLTPEQTEGSTAEDILSTLDSYAYRGRLKNIVSFIPLLKQATSTYTIDGDNSKGEVNLILSDDSRQSIFLTVFSGGMVTVKDHSTIGTRFFDTDPQLYEELSNLIKAHSTPQEE